MKTALILPGAGARGRVQGGQLKAFYELDIPYDMIFGASSGSLNGAVYHSRDIEQLDEFWMNIRNKDVFTWAPWKLMRSDGCFFNSNPLHKLIGQIVNFPALRANPVPFFVSVTDVLRWSSNTFKVNDLTVEDITDVLLASASLPIAFPPVNKDFTDLGLGKTRLVDGGIGRNYPITTAIAKGAERIILLIPSIPEPPTQHNVFGALELTIGLLEEGYLQDQLEAVKILNPNIELIVVRPDEPLGIGLLDFTLKPSKNKELMDYGYQIARKKFEECGLYAKLTVR